MKQMFDGAYVWGKIGSLLNSFAQAEFFRLAMTIAIAVGASLLLSFIQRKNTRIDSSMDMSERRQRTVLARNVVILGAIAAVISLWSTRIAGFALSLAAVAGAMLIVSKEAISNLLGFGMMTVIRPYLVGDFIEITGYKGRVVDVHPMGTTLLEMREGSQITGQTVVIPNSLLLTQAVRNHSATGKYVVFLLPIRIRYKDSVEDHEKALIDAATLVIEPWRAAADEHFTLLENVRNVDLPSAEPRVIIEISHENFFVLNLRFCCIPNHRVKTEQEILRIYLKTRPKPVIDSDSKINDDVEGEKIDG